ncbi:putative P-loop containing nucleoside triphosphate hydrolase [Dioscorea sansibarensis]
MVVDDLTNFVKHNDYYNKIHKAWKHGNLLYGPPSIGKSSLIFIMVNFLKFDTYELELVGIRNNPIFRRLWINMPNKSIIVVEEIDHSVSLKNGDNNYVNINNEKGNNFFAHV